jgi:hypothetical protein
VVVSKKYWLIGICLVLLGLVAGGMAQGVNFRFPRYIPPLKVVGDVANSLTLQDPGGVGKLEKITFQGTRYQAVKLADMINAAGPVNKAEQICLVGLDGFTSVIRAEGIDDCYIAFSAKNGWEAVNLKHPMSSNAKLLNEIVVVSDGSCRDFAFNVIDPDSQLVQITPGQLLTRPLTAFPYPEGKAVVENDGKEYESQVFTKRLVFKLSELTAVNDGENLLVMDEKGNYRLVDDGGYFEVRDNYINYLQPDTRTILERVKGVIVHPPAASITDAYYDAKHYLESGNKVLMVVLDGLTYHQYTSAVANGAAPFLEKIGSATRAVGIYPLETNVGLAAMLTGKTAEESGIAAAGDQVLKVPSIFAEAHRLKKQALLLEAGPKLLETELQPVSSTDQNGNGSADDELFDAIPANLDKGYELFMVRFHGIHDSGQRCGESAEETMQAISATDKYLAEIVSKWPGKVIIAGNPGTSDQLIGAAAKFNNHAMFVPYWRVK